MKKACKILYLDDETQNLHSFKATFRRDFEIFTSSTAKEAMEIIKNENLQIIITDQKMPEITGIEFFKKIILAYPDPIRILLTGYTDIDALADAINIGNIYRYITKPWNELELRNAIKNGIDAYHDKILLREKMIELERTNDELNKFIYSISHDLRAPIASIKGIISLVQMEEKSSEIDAEYWDLINLCTEKLDFYIQKTIQYYKANKNTIENKLICFESLIQNLLKHHIRLENNVEIKININQEIPFYSDEFLLEICLGNLISNALEYQKQEEENKFVEITVDIYPENAFICVKDNGVGIEPQLIEKVFTQFFKGKSHQGSGLGLYIVKQTTNKLKGTIKVISETNKGSVFEINLPNKRCEE